MSELDEIKRLQEQLANEIRYTGYLKEQIKTLEGSCGMYRRLAERRHLKIIGLEEEISELQEMLSDREQQIVTLQKVSE